MKGRNNKRAEIKGKAYILQKARSEARVIMRSELEYIAIREMFHRQNHVRER